RPVVGLLILVAFVRHVATEPDSDASFRPLLANVRIGDRAGQTPCRYPGVRSTTPQNSSTLNAALRSTSSARPILSSSSPRNGWAEPMTKVAARYGVSSSFLAWVCERLNVRRPARGYAYCIGTGRNNSGLKN